MRHLRIDGTPVNLPENGIPVAVQGAVEKAARLNEAKRNGTRARDEADRTLRGARHNETARRAKAYAETGFFGDDESPIDAAEASAEQAQRDLEALRAAEQIAGRELSAAISATSEAWAKSSRADAKKALVKLTTVLRMGEEAAAALRDSIGTLNMLQERQDGSGTLSVQFSKRSHIFSLDAAIEGLRQAVADASAEIESRKKTTGIYTPAADEDEDAESGAIYNHHPDVAERSKPRHEPIRD